MLIFDSYLLLIILAAMAVQSVATTWRGKRVSANANWLPIALGAASLVGNLLGKKKANDAAKDQARLDNEQIAAGNKARTDLMASLKAGGWDPTKVNTLNSGGTRQSTTNTRQSGKTYDRTSRFAEAADQPMEQKLRELVMNQLQAPQQITASERLNQVRAINDASAGAMSSIRNLAGSRGLSAQQLQAAGTPLASGRTAAIANYLGTVVPGQERDLAAAARGEASGFLNERAGQERFGTSDMVTNQVMQGSHTGFNQQGPDIQGSLALMTPQGAVSNKTGTSLFGDALIGGAGLGAAAYDAYKNKPKTATKAQAAAAYNPLTTNLFPR